MEMSRVYCLELTEHPLDQGEEGSRHEPNRSTKPPHHKERQDADLLSVQ